MRHGRSDRAPAPQPRWRGRLLPRPEEEVVDQGLSFDVETLLNRRRMLRAFGLGAVSVGLAACGNDPSATSSASGSASGSATSSKEIPDETAGPYPGDGSNGPDVLEQSGIIRSDIRSSFGDATGRAVGVPMTLELDFKDLARGGSAFAGVAVYVWHCDREGRYSMYSEGSTTRTTCGGCRSPTSAGPATTSSVTTAAPSRSPS
jgi:hypothetical protein